MDREKMKSELQVAGLQIVENQALIDKQQSLITQLEACGVDATEARQLLDKQRNLLSQHQAAWVRFRRLLEQDEQRKALMHSPSDGGNRE
jgi:hypothetical protein